jgi:hypothetical protein
MVLMPQV